jgi:hypothetical protein
MINMFEVKNITPEADPHTPDSQSEQNSAISHPSSTKVHA